MRNIRYLLIAFALALPSVAMAQGTPAKAPPPAQNAEAKQQIEVKGYVLPIMAGIRSAEMSAAALHELSTTDPFERKDARKTAELAEQAVRIAHERAEDLHEMKGLSAAARADAETATKKLKEARSSVESIQRQVGVLEAPFRRNEAENVRKDSERLNSQLSDAERAVQRVADAYRISTKLAFSETTTPTR
jgi:hypothetical protein